MEIPFERWFEAIFMRRSRRQFQSIKLKESDLNNLSSICQSFKPFSEARAVFCPQPPENVLKGAIGKYGKIKGAPCFIAFVGRMDSQYVNEKTGYTGEGIILETTAMGLDTCWVAGFYKPDIAAEIAGADVNEKVIAVCPIGYSCEKWTLEEKLMSGFGRSHKRKPLNELITGAKNDKLIIRLSPVLEMARLAPSAVNRQPWRFNLEEDGITILTNNIKDTFNISKRLDCGIAMLHIEVACLKYGLKGRWNFLPAPKVAKYSFTG